MVIPCVTSRQYLKLRCHIEASFVYTSPAVVPSVAPLAGLPLARSSRYAAAARLHTASWGTITMRAWPCHLLDLSQMDRAMEFEE